MEPLNKVLPTFYELIKEANESDNPVAVLKKGAGNDQRVSVIIGYAFNPNFKFQLPEGMPPYVPTQHPIGMGDVHILNLSSKMYLMCSNDTPRIKKEEIYIKWLESMSDIEAKLMIDIKDQTISKTYEKITDDVICDTLGWDKDMLRRLREKK